MFAKVTYLMSTTIIYIFTVAKTVLIYLQKETRPTAKNLMIRVNA